MSDDKRRQTSIVQPARESDTFIARIGLRRSAGYDHDGAAGVLFVRGKKRLERTAFRRGTVASGEPQWNEGWPSSGRIRSVSMRCEGDDNQRHASPPEAGQGA